MKLPFMPVHIRKYVTEDKSKTQYKTKSTRGTDPQYFNGGGGIIAME